MEIMVVLVALGVLAVVVVEQWVELEALLQMQEEEQE
jgi:Tfp pilus assembly protein PilE